MEATNPMDLSLNDIKARLSEGAAFHATYESFTMSARQIEPGAYAVVGRNPEGGVVLTDGAAGELNLLRVMEQYVALGDWQVGG